jgi:hypothetical protein
VDGLLDEECVSVCLSANVMKVTAVGSVGSITMLVSKRGVHGMRQCHLLDEVFVIDRF